MLLIAGFDSGINSSLCLINLKGELVYLDSGKELENKVLDICTEKGKVIAVSIDKRESRKARKIAASLNSKLILPNHDLSKNKKLSLIKNFRDRKLNSHEKSSLAAAVFAYKQYRQKIKKFEDKIGGAHSTAIEDFILSRKRICCFKN